jgi:hypothetical protein
MVVPSIRSLVVMVLEMQMGVSQMMPMVETLIYPKRLVMGTLQALVILHLGVSTPREAVVLGVLRGLCMKLLF